MDSYTPSLAELEARLAKLERQNRRWKYGGLLCLLIMGAGLVFAQAPRKPPGAASAPATRVASYDTLVVHRLELRDKAGKVRGLWTVTDEVSGLMLSDAAGKLRAVLGVEADGPGLTLYDTARKSRAVLSASASGPGLVLSDTAGKSRAGLVVPAWGPGLALYDTAGGIRAMLSVGAEGPGLRLSDTAGKTRAGLAVVATGSFLALTDAAEKPQALFSEDAFSVTDAQGFKAVVGATELETIRTGESHKTSAAAVTLFGKDGKVIWRAP